MRDKGPTDDEVRAAKYNLIGGYGLRLETGADLAEQLLSADLDGLDSQFVAEYPARLDAISVAEAARAAAQHLDPRALIIVGKAAEVGPLLKKAGYTKVEVIHYLDPVSASERKALQVSRAGAAEVMPADAIEGKRLVDLALAAQGGAAAVARIKALRMVGKGTMKAQGQEVPLTVEVRQLVDQAMREDVDLGTMRMVQVFVPGKRGFLRQGDKQMDMPAEMKAEMERATFRDPLFILVHASAPGAKVRGLKPIVDGGVTYDAFEVVSPKNDVTRVLLDPKSHLPARLVYSAEGKQVRDELGDYRVVEGVELPFRAKHDTGDEKIDISYDKIELNPKLAPDLFQ